MSDIVFATGRRKNAIARVYIKKGDGKIFINKRNVDNYFPRKTHQMQVTQALEIADFDNSNYEIFIRVNGGGNTGQAGAIRHAMARALIKVDEKNRGPLKRNKLLRRDPRMVERKKCGKRGARRSFQFSKR